MNYFIEPASHHTCGNCGYLMDEETANITDNLLDLGENFPEYLYH